MERFSGGLRRRDYYQIRRVIAMDARKQAIEELEKRMKHEQERRMFERYQTILLHYKGKKVKEIAEILGRCKPTIRTYIKTYKHSGLDGLQMKFSTGAPVQLTKEQQDQLKQIIVKHLPHEVGFTAKHNWTLLLAAEYVKREFGQSYTLAGMSKLMHRLGLSFTKPTYTLAAADEAKQKEFIEVRFPMLKKDT